MANGVQNTVTLWDRFVAIVSYFTFGLAGFIWIIASLLIFKKPLSKFCAYHIYQSIFISVLLGVTGMVLNYLFTLTVQIPYVGKAIYFLNLYLFRLPIFWTFSLVHFIIFVIITYLSLGALIGKMTYFPFISDVIKSNFRN